MGPDFCNLAPFGNPGEIKFCLQQETQNESKLEIILNSNPYRSNKSSFLAGLNPKMGFALNIFEISGFFLRNVLLLTISYLKIVLNQKS